jgi:hypothetical protein
MTVPNLIHPVRCTLRKTVRAGTSYDEDAREAIQSVKYGKELRVNAQPNFQSLGDEETYKNTGRRVMTSGYLLFRYVDLRRADGGLCLVLEEDDRIVQVGHRKVDIYIYKLEDTGHYPDQDGSSLIKAHCRDRNPSHNKPGAL